MVGTFRNLGTRSWLVVVGAIVVIAHLPSFAHQLLDGDEAVYASIAALMNQGGRLYADGGVDNKPPGIFWVYALTFRVFGNYQMTAVHVITLAAVAATCAVIFVIARQMGGVRAGLVAALAYGVFTGAGYPRLAAANTELFMMPLLAASFLLMLRRHWAYAGVTLVLAGAFKQVAVANLVVLPFALWMLEPAPRRLRAGMLFAAGIGGSAAVVLAVVALTGSLSGLLHWTVGILGGYAAQSWQASLLWQRFIGGPQGGPLQFLETTAVLWPAAVFHVRHPRRLRPQDKLVAVWLVSGVAGALAGGHMFGHYFIQVLGPLAVLAGLGIDEALKGRWRRWAAGITIAGIGLPLLGWTAYDWTADPLTYDWGTPVAQHRLIASYIADNSSPDQRVFVWGDWPALYVESDRLMATRFPGFLRGFARGSGLPPDNWDTTPEVFNELQSDLTAHPPVLIVDTSTATWSDFRLYPMKGYPSLESLVASRYTLVATVDGVDIYARNPDG